MSGFRSRFLSDEGGEAAVGFAFVMPVLVLISLSILEFSLIVFDYHRAGEATRRGARTAALSSPIMAVSGLTSGGTVSCTSSGGGVSCAGATVEQPAVFDTLIAEMQAIQPAIKASNVVIDYVDVGLGDATTPGGIIPMVTVKIVNLERPFLMLSGFPGFGPSITYPAFSTSQIGSGMGPAW
ncbi:MAG: TadE/TadG family type IV pilus assembly protein [Alphaproteobacteria bacterium]